MKLNQKEHQTNIISDWLAFLALTQISNLGTVAELHVSKGELAQFESVRSQSPSPQRAQPQKYKFGDNSRAAWQQRASSMAIVWWFIANMDKKLLVLVFSDVLCIYLEIIYRAVPSCDFEGCCVRHHISIRHSCPYQQIIAWYLHNWQLAVHPQYYFSGIPLCSPTFPCLLQTTKTCNLLFSTCNFFSAFSDK